MHDSDTRTGRGYLWKRYKHLKSQREPHESTWRDLQRYLAPECGRLNDEKGEINLVPDYSYIYNGEPVKAREVFVAFLMAGMSSPARPWFKLVSSEEGLELSSESKNWLHYYGQLMLQVFATSNLYQRLPQIYREASVFGNGVMLCEEDEETVVRFTDLTVGEYWFGTAATGEVNTLYRQFEMRALQMVEKFGIENVSERVRRDVQACRYSNRHTIIHAIEPQRAGLPAEIRPRDKRKKYISVYFEEAKQETPNGGILRVAGYDEMPVMTLRMGARQYDAYGVGIGHYALPDIKQIQREELQRAKAVDYMVDPEKQTFNQDVDEVSFPGKIHHLNPSSPGDKGVWPVHQVNLPIQYVDQTIFKIEERVRQWFYNDLAKHVMLDQRSNVTAREIDAIEQEKLLLAGPVIESVQNFLSPIINATFEIMVKNGIGQPPPPDMGGRSAKIEYLGLMSQAQKAIGTRSMERTWEFAAALRDMTGDQSVMHKLKPFEAIDDFVDLVGSPADQVRSNDEAEQLAAAEQQQMQMQEQMASMQQGANVAKTMADTPMGDSNALAQAMATVGAN